MTTQTPPILRKLLDSGFVDTGKRFGSTGRVYESENERVLYRAADDTISLRHSYIVTEEVDGK